MERLRKKLPNSGPVTVRVNTPEAMNEAIAKHGNLITAFVASRMAKVSEQRIFRLWKAFHKEKQRRVPLWPQTQKRLRRWLKDNHWPPQAPLLPNRFGQRLTRAGAAYQLQQLVKRACLQMPILKKRGISPHSFRHATARALLEAQVPTEVLALYLGHESPQTTHI